MGGRFSGDLNFNCTIQELKLLQMRTSDMKTTEFQLHHTGIKTICSAWWAMYMKRFQLHHTGIKTKGERQFAELCVHISIAPYRN